MTSSDGIPTEYKPRNPENTKLYKIIQEHINTFYQERELEGRTVPEYIKKEFDSFLECGIHAHGFVRVHCDNCGHELVVAFSCKKRGICPSCGARRMAEIAIHLVDNLIPIVPTRQYVLTLPYPLRLGISHNKDLLAEICSLTIKEISKFITSKTVDKTGVTKKEVFPGLALFVQRFGSSLNLNPHFHIISLDGVFVKKSTGRLKFYNIDAPTNEDIAKLVKNISDRINKYLVKIGYLYECEGEYGLENTNSIFENTEDDLHLPAMAASISHKIAFGENTGKDVSRLKDTYSGNYWPVNGDPELKGDRCALSGGYSLHGNTALKSDQRERLEKLISYMSRPCIAEERIEILENNKIRIKLKSKWSDGTTHIELTPLEIIEKLVALIPPPFFHLQRYYGILSSHAKNRADVIPDNDRYSELNVTAETNNKGGFAKNAVPKKKYISFAELLKRVFKIDILQCSKCGSRMKVQGVYTNGFLMRFILESLGINTNPPMAAPAYNRGIFSYEYS